MTHLVGNMHLGWDRYDDIGISSTTKFQMHNFILYSV